MNKNLAGSRVGALLAAGFVVLTLAACGQPQASTAATDDPSDDTAAAVLAAYRSYGGEVLELSSANPVVTAKVDNLQGSVPAYDLTGGNPPCGGLVRPVPSLVFTLGEGAGSVNVAFAGNQLSSLLVVAQGEAIVCDSSAPPALKPELTLESPVAGRYGVWVGRVDTQHPINGEITVSLAQ